VAENGYKRGLIREFDWGLFLLTIGIALFGVICIYAAYATPVEEAADTFLETLAQQDSKYARLQLLWLIAGLVVLFGMVFFDYHVFLRYADLIYWTNLILLAVVLGMKPMRGNMTGWFRIGTDRTIQPSEFGKIAIIISLAKMFAARERPIMSPGELIRPLTFVGFPLILIVLQPDVGTALVYIAIFAVVIFFSGTNWRLIVGIIALATLLIIPLWYLLNVSEDSFRLNRLMVYLDPTYDLSGSGMQVANAKIAIGSGGLWGKGMFSEGCFASLNYIPDDYTDFVFAIVCETFGFVGAGSLILAFMVLIVRMVVIAYNTEDAFGRYLVIGVTGMLFFHIFENAGMVVGLLPVTGIPLPFISYGGSNMFASMAGIGIVLNVAMRTRATKRTGKKLAVVEL
jgi:rod shape determining protein RodA